MSKERIFFLVVILVLIIIILLKGCGGSEPEVKIDYKYKTKFVDVPVPYEVIKMIEDTTPPSLVIRYKDVPVPYEVQVVPDSMKLLIRNLEDSLKSVLIDKRFLTKFPSAAKLINFDLKYDSLNITILNTQGETNSKLYPMDFDNYKYQWYDNQLHHEDFKRKKPKDNTKWKQLYGGAGYDFIQQAPVLGFDYNVKFKRVKVTAGTTMHLQANPFITGTAKIGFRLFK